MSFIQALVTWLEKRGGAAAQVISTVSEAEKMIEDQEVVVLGFFSDLECAEAEAYRDGLKSGSQVARIFHAN